MSLVLADMVTELKNRARVLGAFAASDSVFRMRSAIRKAAAQVWGRQDWDFKNSTTTITTTAGNLGPYTAPTGMVRLATTQRKSVFGYSEKDVLSPIASTDTLDWTPYVKVQDGALYFFDDPGNQSLALNYLPQVDNSNEEANVAAFLLEFDAGLYDAVMVIAEADIRKDLPGMRAEALDIQKEGLQLADDYWEEVTRDRYQKTIAPKGLNRVPVDFSARTVTVLGAQLNTTARVL